MAENGEKIAEFREVARPEDKLPLVCDLTARHFEQRQAVAIRAGGPQEAEELDSLLWTWRQNSFVPHVRLEQAEPEFMEPVVIFQGGDPGLDADVLILASADEPPDWLGRFAHIHDFALVYDEGLRTAGRARFVAYREAGYQMRFAKAADR